jgi:hypothetical protein
MTLKANANRQSTVNFFHGDRHVAGRAAIAVPELRRVSRHAGQFLAEAISDANANIAAVTFVAGATEFSERRNDTEVRVAAALDDEDEDGDEDLEDDDLDEDDAEDLEDEDEEDFDDDDDLGDEDDELDDDDLVDDEDDEDEDE